MNLVEMIGKYVPTDMLSKMGSASGLGADDSRKVASGAVPLVAAGIAQVGSTEEGAGRLLELARQTGAEDTVGRFGDMLGSDESRRSLVEHGGGILSSLFGARGDTVLDAFSAQTGASRTGTHSFLAMLAPVALGVLGHHARSQGLGAAGLASMLSGQAGLLANMIPGGLGRLLGGAVPGMPGREPREPSRFEEERQREVPRVRTEPVRTAERGVQRRRFPAPIAVLAIGLAFLAWALLRQRPEPQRQARAPEPTATEPTAATPGMQRTAPSQGIDALASYSGSDLQGRRFSLTEISLDTGNSQLSQQSAQQVDTLAGAMKNHASMKVRLEGERADSVRDALATRGILAERVSTAKTSSGGQSQDPRLVDVVVVEQ
jgi:hypothetical protein